MTEKDHNPQQKEKKAMKKQEAVEKAGDTPLQNPKMKKPIETPKKIEGKKTKEIKEEQKTPEKKEVKKETPKIKKTEVSAKGINLPISTKDAKFICKFIVKKRIGDAIRDLEKVELGKKAVPMKGEIPHRKGKRISSGRFPKKAAKNFLNVLKSLAANANQNNLDEPIITEAIANMAERPYGRFGRTQKKRTHIKIIAKEKKKNNEKPKVSQAIKHSRNKESRQRV